MLKPMLARGELRMVGATTLDEYRERIEKDPALERRFQQVFVGEPSVEDTIGILRGLKEKYEAHHKVAISDAALVAAATLSDRYITSRFLPDKAIDLVDEAASRLRMEIDSSPVEIDQLQRQVDRLRMEELALAKETDEASVARLAKLRTDLADKEEQLAALRARWDQEKAGLDRVGDLKIQIDELRMAADRAQREGDFESAARILYGELPALESQLETVAAEANDRSAMVREEVGPDDVAEVVGAWTGIPAGRLLEGETAKLLRMEDELGRRVVGQATAVRAVSDAVRRARAGIADPDRPTGSFLFLGPTGVGKTELAKALAEFLFDDERAITRIDMSEYGEKHSVARLVGAPPGYVGYEEGGQLTEAVRRRPYTVVLLDEVEKAHPEVFNVLLQVLDDGRLTDGQGRTVDFRNAILILTSNLGSQALIDPTLTPEQRHDAVMAVVRSAFKPEFLNRLDDTIMFDALTREDLAAIVDIQVEALARRLADRRITLEVDPAAREWLADHGFDPLYGARPLRRLIQTAIGDPLARGILAGEFRDGSTVRVEVGAQGTDQGLGPDRAADQDHGLLQVRGRFPPRLEQVPQAHSWSERVESGASASDYVATQRARRPIPRYGRSPGHTPSGTDGRPTGASRGTWRGARRPCDAVGCIRGRAEEQVRMSTDVRPDARRPIGDRDARPGLQRHRPGHRLVRGVPGVPRRHDRQRRVPEHPRVVPGLHDQQPVVDPQRLQHRLRGVPRPVRPADRPDRPAARVRLGRAGLHRRLGRSARSRRRSAFLIGARVVQALGAAMLVPASLALVVAAFPAGAPDPRRRAVGGVGRPGVRARPADRRPARPDR